MADKQGATGVPNILLPGGGSSRRSRPQQQQQDYRASTASEQAPDYTSVYEQPIGNARPMSSMTDALPDESPPPYGEVAVQNGEISGDANLAADGRINININSASLRFAEFIAPSLQRNSSVKGRPVTVHKSRYADEPPAYVPPGLGLSPEGTPPPRMNIVIQIVGSRGDVQPFVALGKVLKEQFNHRVRIATHGDFKAFVEDNGLEFFCIGGNPAELMAFMVKNPGLVPGMGSLASGEIGRRRKGVQEMIEGAWRSCFEPGDGNSAPLPPRGTPEEKAHQVDFEFYQKPFVADAIIANPPSFAHIHVAEKMGIPLHLMFTMPWSPTRSFPHPLANIQSSNAKDVGTTNTVSYALVEMLTWQGLADVINKFRTERLGLEALDAVWTPGLVNRLQIPYTYCWSPALIPKPEDWGDNIDISGFFMLDLASDYTPPADLEAFLNAGEPPVYIGFGSIVVDDPNALTNLIFEAVRKTGVRALVSKGWGGLGGDSLEVPPNVFMLGNCPHDWLFKRVSAVVHHGGAGTSSAGIHAGVPTAIVPFFGDQPFWGAMIARAGAGPDPIPFAQLTASKLADALVFCARDDIRAKAEELGARIRVEKGTQKGAEYFHKHLYYEDLRCALIPDRAAVWRTNQTKIRLSAVATSLLVEQGLLSWSDVSLYRPRDYNTEAEPWEPFSGITASFVNDCANIAYAIGDLPYSSIKAGFNKGKSASQHNRRVRRGIDSTLMAAPSSSKLDDFEGKAIVGSYHENQKPASSSSSRTSISRKPVSSEKMLASPPPSAISDIN